MRLSILIFSFFAVLIASSQTIQKKPIFPSVQIGSQTWMAENLNVDRFRNGDPIVEAKTLDEWYKYCESRHPAWCSWALVDTSELDYESRYGKLYNCYAVIDPRGLAPSRWHIPNDNEWMQLVNYLGGENEAGKKMRSTSGWSKLSYVDDPIDGSNESGFNAKASGGIFQMGESWAYAYPELYAFWWSSDVDPKIEDYSAKFWCMCGWGSFSQDCKNAWGASGLGLSVRCLKD